MEARATILASARLWGEFLGIFVAAPLTMAFVLPPTALFPALFGLTVIGLALLAWTPGFTWTMIVRGKVRWGEVAAFAALCAVVSFGVVRVTAPDALFFLAINQPMLLAMIWVLYPVLSALPQELVFRPLFFARYGALIPGGWAGITLNAALFSLAHLMFWSWIVAAMTFFGGLAFAYAYRVQRSFPQALALHSIAGIVVFTFGLGIFFYSGNVERPF